MCLAQGCNKETSKILNIYHMSQKKLAQKNTDRCTIEKYVLNEGHLLTYLHAMCIVFLSLAKDRDDFHKISFEIWLKRKLTCGTIF